MGDMGNESKGQEPKLQKSYFDVLGLCCSSEVPLIENILVPLEGVQKVTVIVPSKTVIVFHDNSLISQLQIAKALNQVKLEATIRAYGTTSKVKRWPNPYILICGVLLLASFFKHFFHPLQWLAVAAAVVGLPPILFRSIASLRNYNLDINILMVIAVAGAVALRDYSEAGSIVFLFTIAEWLTSTASHKVNAGMSTLMSMAPQKAILAETGQVVDAQSVQVDTVLAVKAGELIPIDGIVVEGRSEVNESSLTGESFPVSKQPESLVWAGTLNVDGYISVRTTALAENSAVAKMARLVEEAQNNRSKTQRLIDSFAKYYTPAVVIIAGGVAVIPLILRVHNPKHWFQLALILIVSACPCALVLSTPVATFNALLTAAKMGLLIKGGDVLEALAKTRVVAFDKTGTITMGEFTVMDCRSISPNIAPEKLLYWISSIECKSSHPMASAVVDYARSKSVEPKPENVSKFQIYPGEGIYGEMDGKKIYVGNKRIAERAGCATVPNIEDMKDAITHGYVFSGPVPIGIFTLFDTCRTGSADAIKELKSLRIKTAMLTGDSTVAAMHAQNQLGNSIEMLHSALLPEDKVRIISDLKTSEGPTVMVGDGLNDAPALAIANVGISMGISGSAVAMETSHITLMSNDIQKIPRAIRLARRTHRKIIVNMFISVITKLAIIGLAIAGHPLLWAAVLADVGTCLVVILNSMTLLRVRMANGHSHHRGSSHKSHAHKHGGHAHCAGGSHAHSCHDHGRAEEERPHPCCVGSHESLAHKPGFGEERPHACCVGSHESLAHNPGFGKSAGACSQSKCSSGMHGHTSHGHETTERQSCHDHESAGACGQSKCSSGMHGHTCHGHGTTKRHNCHDHEAAAEERAHHKCQTKCKKDSNMDSHNEHLISIKKEEECHEDVLYRAHLTAEKKEKDRCCGSERAECGSKDGCREELLEDHCHNTKCKPSQGEENKDMGGCCGSERELAERESCPWSVECTGHREIHGCGMRYRKHCEKHHSCCGDGIVQLPEIVIAD